MRDPDIRSALNAALQRQHAGDQHTLIRQELGLCAGTRRIDVAVINGEIAGFEIKSDLDTLARLSGQSHIYAKVLDRATLVTTARHIGAATTSLPDWWELIVAEPADCIQLTTVRCGRLNISVEPFAIAQLLWKEEALQELRQRGLGHGLATRARFYTWERLASSLSLEELRRAVRDRLRARDAWPGGQ